MEKIGRNEPCGCGSGKKYKHCCGNLSSSSGKAFGSPANSAPSSLELAAEKREALEYHARKELQKAAQLYRKILLQHPKDFDALHMLGVIYGQSDRLKEALQFLLEAASVDEEGSQLFLDNLGRALFVAAEKSGDIDKALCPDLAGEWMSARLLVEDLPVQTDPLPIVSIVVPCGNHESYVAEAIRSLFLQTYPAIEIIIIDYGSRDGSMEKIKQLLPESPYPIRLEKIKNHDLPVVINEGIELGGGSYVGILSPYDRYASRRVESMVRLLNATRKDWGFSGLKFIDSNGLDIQYGQNDIVDNMMQSFDRLYWQSSLTIGFGGYHYALSTGNLFFRKEFFKCLGGFSDHKYLYDWDFCLRAIANQLPAVLYEPTYDCRVHGEETNREIGEQIEHQKNEMLSAWARNNIKKLPTGSLQDRLAECIGYKILLSVGQGRFIGRERLINLAKRFLDVDSSS